MKNGYTITELTNISIELSIKTLINGLSKIKQAPKTILEEFGKESSNEIAEKLANKNFDIRDRYNK